MTSARLPRLTAMAATIGPASHLTRRLRRRIDRARILDNHYEPARYPNGHVEGPAFEHYGSLHSSQALDHARAIIDFVRKALAGA